MQQKKKILIAEDEESIRKILVRHITMLGHTVYVAGDGQEVLKLLQEKQPDLLLLDMIMPVKNGFDVLQEMRLTMNSKIPVIVISNLESKQDTESAKNLGISGYVTKADITLRDLSTMVDNVLNAPIRA